MVHQRLEKNERTSLDMSGSGSAFHAPLENDHSPHDALNASIKTPLPVHIASHEADDTKRQLGNQLRHERSNVAIDVNDSTKHQSQSASHSAGTNNDDHTESGPAHFHDEAAEVYSPNPITLADLDPVSRSLQARYWGLIADTDLARCDICSSAGHLPRQCPSRKCKHCHTIDVHFAAACPLVQLCTRCRSRGHAAASCPSKLARSAADGFTCGICGGPHKDELCSHLWRTFTPAASGAPQRLRTVDDVRVSCYECGAAGHWGDDCLSRPRAKISQCNTFSAAFASQFFAAVNEPPARQQQQPQQQQNRHPSSNGFSIRGRGIAASSFPRNTNARTAADGDDPTDDEVSAFYGRRVDRAPQRGGIQIAYRAPLAAQQHQQRPARRVEPQMAFGPPAQYDNGARRGYQAPLPDERSWRPRPPV